MTKIAFISQLPIDSQEKWLTQLSIALPNEQIVLLKNMSEADIKGCQMAIVANPRPEELAKLPQLIWVQSLWAGVENLVNELQQPSFKLCRLIDPQLSEIMSEAVLAWTLYLHRNMPAYAKQQKNKQWHQIEHLLPSERTIGVLGLGKLGEKSAIRLVDNGFKVKGWSLTPKVIANVECYNGFDGESGLNEMISSVDILVCLLPLTNETKHLLNQELLAKLPNSAGIINFARGEIIHSEALIQALDNNQLSHAVLDVFDKEPLEASSPLWRNDNITVLPHISAPTHFKSASEIVANNIIAFREKGLIPPSVDFKKGY